MWQNMTAASLCLYKIGNPLTSTHSGLCQTHEKPLLSKKGFALDAQFTLFPKQSCNSNSHNLLLILFHS